MGKKKLRTKQFSKGSMNNMSPKLSKAVAADLPLVTKMQNKLDAYSKGKKVWMTIPNPNPNETNKRFIRVLATSVLGDPKKRNYIMSGTGEQKEKRNERL